MSAPTHLHSTYRSALAAAVRAFSRAVTAWREVSAAGAAHTVCAANGMVTLMEHSLFAPLPPPAPGALVATADDAAASLAWMQASLARLGRVLRGLQDHAIALRSFGLNISQDAESNPVLATLSQQRWNELYEAGVACLLRDIADKERCVDLLCQVLDGKARVDHGALEMGAEVWLEMPRADSCALDLVSAAYEAEMYAWETVESELSPAGLQDGSSIYSSPGASSKADVSPALSLLLSGGSGRGSKKKK